MLDFIHNNLNSLLRYSRLLYDFSKPVHAKIFIQHIQKIETNLTVLFGNITMIIPKMKVPTMVAIKIETKEFNFHKTKRQTKLRDKSP